MALQGRYRMPVEALNEQLNIAGLTANVICVSTELGLCFGLDPKGVSTATRVEDSYVGLPSIIGSRQRGGVELAVPKPLPNPRDANRAQLIRIAEGHGHPGFGSVNVNPPAMGLVVPADYNSPHPLALAMPFGQTPAVYFVYFDYERRNPARWVLVTAAVSCDWRLYSRGLLDETFRQIGEQVTGRSFRFKPHKLWAFLSPGPVPATTFITRAEAHGLPGVKNGHTVIQHRPKHEPGKPPYELYVLSYLRQLLQRMQVTPQRIIMLGKKALEAQADGESVWKESATAGNVLAGVVQ